MKALSPTKRAAFDLLSGTTEERLAIVNNEKVSDLLAGRDVLNQELSARNVKSLDDLDDASKADVIGKAFPRGYEFAVRGDVEEVTMLQSNSGRWSQ